MQQLLDFVLWSMPVAVMGGLALHGVSWLLFAAEEWLERWLSMPSAWPKFNW